MLCWNSTHLGPTVSRRLVGGWSTPAASKPRWGRERRDGEESGRRRGGTGCEGVGPSSGFYHRILSPVVAQAAHGKLRGPSVGARHDFPKGRGQMFSSPREVPLTPGSLLAATVVGRQFWIGLPETYTISRVLLKTLQPADAMIAKSCL